MNELKNMTSEDSQAQSIPSSESLFYFPAFVLDGETIGFECPMNKEHAVNIVTGIAACLFTRGIHSDGDKPQIEGKPVSWVEYAEDMHRKTLMGYRFDNDTRLTVLEIVRDYLEHHPDEALTQIADYAQQVVFDDPLVKLYKMETGGNPFNLIHMMDGFKEPIYSGSNHGLTPEQIAKKNKERSKKKLAKKAKKRQRR